MRGARVSSLINRSMARGPQRGPERRGKARRQEANFSRVAKERSHLSLPSRLIRITKQSFSSQVMGFREVDSGLIV